MSDKIITIPGVTGQNESFVWEEVSDKSGNCFYESIAHLIKGDSRRCGSIRADISQYIYNHWDIFKNFISDEDFKKAGISLKKPVDVLKNSPDQAEQEYLREKYKDLINTRGVWGDSTSIKAASEVFKVNIVIVKENGEKIQQYPDPNNSNPTYRKTIYLRYQGGNHYQPLINLKEKTAKIWAANIPDDAILTSLAREQIVGILLITDKKKLEAELFEYLRTKSDEELKKFYISILKFSKPKEETVLPKKKQPELSETFSGIFESFASLFSNPVFIESLTKLFAGFRTIFHKIMVAFNPGAELDESEKEEPYGEYSEIFSSAGEAGRKLYRKLLEEIKLENKQRTKEQFLNELLKKLKRDEKGLFSKDGNKVVTQIEEAIFAGKDNNSIADMIEENLLKAYVKHKNGTATDAEKDVFKQGILLRIKNNFLALKTKIDDLINKIKDKDSKEGLSDTQKIELWKIIQRHRLKLAHFMLKTKAFSEGKAVTFGKEFKEKFEKYMGLFDKAEVIAINNNVNNIYLSIPEEDRKSLLRSFDIGNKNKNRLANEAKFDEALESFGISRYKEISKLIEAQHLRISGALERLTIEVSDTVATPQVTASKATIKSKLDALKTILKEQLTTLNTETIDTLNKQDKVLSFGHYNPWKEKTNKRENSISQLEQSVDSLISAYYGPAVPATTGVPAAATGGRRLGP